MKKEDPFKKRREALKKRKHDFRTPKANSYLIVTEGKRTEPNYFNGLAKEILAKVGGTVEVIDIYGEGASTQKLIEIAEMRANKAKIPYQYIWVVFDKDDFEDFDLAIKEGEAKGYHVAWSNQSFEYWIYLHLIIATRICTDKNGMPNLMSYLNLMDFQKTDMAKISRTYMNY